MFRMKGLWIWFLQKNRVDLSSISEVRSYVTEWPRFFGPPCILSLLLQHINLFLKCKLLFFSALVWCYRYGDHEYNNTVNCNSKCVYTLQITYVSPQLPQHCIYWSAWIAKHSCTMFPAALKHLSMAADVAGMQWCFRCSWYSFGNFLTCSCQNCMQLIMLQSAKSSSCMNTGEELLFFAVCGPKFTKLGLGVQDWSFGVYNCFAFSNQG